MNSLEKLNKKKRKKKNKTLLDLFNIMQTSERHTVPQSHSGLSKSVPIFQMTSALLKYRADKHRAGWNGFSHTASAHTGRRPGIDLHCDLHPWRATTRLSI